MTDPVRPDEYIIAFPGGFVAGTMESTLDRARIFVQRHGKPVMLYKLVEIGLVPVLPNAPRRLG